MLHQGRFAGLDIFGGHDALASLAASGSAGWISGTAACAWASCTIASGCEAKSCASAAVKVSGIGASSLGVSGVAATTGGSIVAVSVVVAAGLSIPSISRALLTSRSS
jgi:hypothetical protein